MSTTPWETLPTSVKIRWNHSVRELWIDDKWVSSVPTQKVLPGVIVQFGTGSEIGSNRLALAILLKFIPQKQAELYHLDFCFTIVKKWPQKDFEIFLNLREELLRIVQQRIHTRSA